MRAYLKIGGLVLFVFCSGTFALQAKAESSSALIAEALELLQKDQKAKALKVLEKAFDAAQDPESVKDAAILILEASPENYSKRDAYLKYLTSRAREHADVWKWHKELGDRAFNRGDFQAAEEAYLNAQSSAPDPLLIKYKIAWTFWNQKRRTEAMSIFLDLIPKVEASLQTSIINDIAKLWWELGPMPATTFSKIFSTSIENQQQLFSEFFNQFPREQNSQPKIIELLKQIRDDEKTKSYWQEFLARDLFFQKDPCFMIQNIYGPEDFASPASLLSCVKSNKHPTLEILERHFERALPTADENFIRAYAQVLNESQKCQKAVQLMTGWNGFDDAQSDYYSVIGNITSALNEETLKGIYASVAPEKWEKILKESKGNHLLTSLQNVDPERWVRYEEENFTGKKVPREFLIKKATYLAQDYSNKRDEIEKIVNDLLEIPKNPEEKSARSVLKSLDEHAGKELPKTFDDDFTHTMSSWISQIDRDLDTYQRLSGDWQKLVLPLVREKLQKNIDQLTSQIDRANLPENSPEDLNVEFLNKKADIRDQMRKKYEDFLRPS